MQQQVEDEAKQAFAEMLAAIQATTATFIRRSAGSEQ
jgi:hypothetical protein